MREMNTSSCGDIMVPWVKHIHAEPSHKKILLINSIVLAHGYGATKWQHFTPTLNV